MCKCYKKIKKNGIFEECKDYLIGCSWESKEESGLSWDWCIEIMLFRILKVMWRILFIFLNNDKLFRGFKKEGNVMRLVWF